MVAVCPLRLDRTQPRLPQFALPPETRALSCWTPCGHRGAGGAPLPRRADRGGAAGASAPARAERGSARVLCDFRVPALPTLRGVTPWGRPSAATAAIHTAPGTQDLPGVLGCANRSRDLPRPSGCLHGPLVGVLRAGAELLAVRAVPWPSAGVELERGVHVLHTADRPALITGGISRRRAPRRQRLIEGAVIVVLFARVAGVGASPGGGTEDACRLPSAVRRRDGPCDDQRRRRVLRWPSAGRRVGGAAPRRVLGGGDRLLPRRACKCPTRRPSTDRGASSDARRASGTARRVPGAHRARRDSSPAEMATARVAWPRLVRDLSVARTARADARPHLIRAGPRPRRPNAAAGRGHVRG